MKIGIDIMGGDFAPEAIVLGSILAHNELKDDSKIVLIGDKNEIHKILEKENFDAANFEIVHSESVIGMGEHPAKAFSQKQDSSIAIGFKLLATNQIQGFCSAGNTGAMMVGSLYTVKQIPGIIRPCISTVLPRIDGTNAILMDVGINPDCKPDVLYQYAIIGSIYAKEIYKLDSPRVALLNIGEEEEKGSLLTQATYKLQHFFQ